MKRLPLYAAVWALCAVLAGCASLGLATAKSFPERVAYALGTNTGLRDAATHGLEQHTLSSADGEYVLSITDRSRTLIDAAQGAYQGGDVSTAEGRLTLALNVLEQLQAYLDKKVSP